MTSCLSIPGNLAKSVGVLGGIPSDLSITITAKLRYCMEALHNWGDSPRQIKIFVTDPETIPVEASDYLLGTEESLQNLFCFRIIFQKLILLIRLKNEMPIIPRDIANIHFGKFEERP